MLNLFIAGSLCLIALLDLLLKESFLIFLLRIFDDFHTSELERYFLKIEGVKPVKLTMENDSACFWVIVVSELGYALYYLCLSLLTS